MYEVVSMLVIMERRRVSVVKLELEGKGVSRDKDYAAPGGLSAR